MPGSAYKKCKCVTERCNHPWWLDYKPAGALRVRKSVLDAFGAVVPPQTPKRDVEQKYLAKFVEEIHAAARDGRQPFRLVANRVDSAVTSFEHYVKTIYVPGYYEVSFDKLKTVGGKNTKPLIHAILARFGKLPLKQLEQVDTVKAWKIELRDRGLKPASVNRNLAKLKQILNWGLHHQNRYVGYVPFGKSAVTIDTKKEHERDRRLLVEPDEERILLTQAREMQDAEMMELRIVAAIDCCVRRGEMLLVQNKNVEYREGIIKLPKYAERHGEEVRGTKTAETRIVPITPRLTRLLEKRRLLGPNAYVFGTIEGHFQESFAKTWATLRLLAYGHTPEWTAKNGLTPSSQQALQEINLHWHDLRHEGASRYGQSGKFSLKELMELLGHRNPKTTMRYWQLGQGAVKKAVLAAAKDIADERARLDREALKVVG